MASSSSPLKSKRFFPSFEASQLDALRSTLAQCRTSLPAPTYASMQASKDGKNYGVTSEWMDHTLEYWHESFDWSKREKNMNSVDHYMTTIDDAECGQFKAIVNRFQIHYIAHFSPDPTAIPLLLFHGWPGSAHEFTEAIKLLSKPSSSSSSPSFSIVCPNQPGYGWSSGPPLDRSFGMYDVARICHALMLGLGFKSYVAQGGDIGSVIARIMASRYKECRAVNLNYLPLLPASGQWVSGWDTGLNPREKDNAYKAFKFAMTGRGYGTMHGTRPATIGIIVQSSPTALLAWLGEKLLEWTEQDPDLDHLLEIVTTWWLLGTFPKSIYAYAELTSGVGTWHRDPKLYIYQPFGFSSFGHEIASAPEAWAKETGRLEFYRYHEKGGHFAAMERPEDFAQDMRDCFGKLWHLKQ
ncbi:BQ2448_4666 [Microbotryum intermedium]|uniref:BQ2448_4666 protein n=1 Tax=Microbotryum intermedium TaxID=269621 RepID=A0A238FDR9_9BASI|nr:BQ2448_4666 [Microbotryum intermedium]